MAITLLIAGHETTAAQLSNFVYVLLHRPKEFARLAAEPDLVPGAVEELSRYVPLASVGSFVRIASEDIDVGCTLVRQGEAIYIHLPAANRDGAVFTNPNEIDFDRPSCPHLVYGVGAHHCLGAQLATMELQVMLRSIVTRLPGLRLAVADDDVPWHTESVFRGPRELPVSW
jgi:nocardicin N-oxygenase